jgi:hypothetical protein
MKEADLMVGFLRIRAAWKARFPDSPGSQKVPGRDAPTASFISSFAKPRRRRPGMPERSDEIPERKGPRPPHPANDAGAPISTTFRSGSKVFPMPHPYLCNHRADEHFASN